LGGWVVLCCAAAGAARSRTPNTGTERKEWERVIGVKGR
jgi:hypothetical protein